MDEALAARGRALSHLVLRGLTKRFGQIVAVESLDLAVERGEFIGLLGPSGCGKTTTLQMIAGFEEPSAGSIELDGADLGAIAANRRNIGIVFQSYALFPHMSVAQNVSFGLEMRRLPRAERQTKVRRALELVHLEGLAERYPRHLSGGQQQRVALARALVIEPRLLLLDEPLSNLDAKLREEMQIELRHLQRSLGVTTVLVTHDQNEAMALCDRIAVMKDGAIVQIDEPWRAYERPLNAFVSGFLGKTNVVRARRAGTGRARVGGFEFALEEEQAGEEFELWVRPERLLVVGEGGLRGAVRTRIFLGGAWLYQVETEAGTLLLARQNTGERALEPGEAIGLAWAPSSARVAAA